MTVAIRSCLVTMGLACEFQYLFLFTCFPCLPRHPYFLYSLNLIFYPRFVIRYPIETPLWCNCPKPTLRLRVQVLAACPDYTTDVFLPA